MSNGFNGVLEARTKLAIEELAKDDIQGHLKMAERDRFMQYAMLGTLNQAAADQQTTAVAVQKALLELIDVTKANREVCGGVQQTNTDLADLIRKNEALKKPKSSGVGGWLSENRAKALVILMTGLSGLGAGIWQAITGLGN